MPASLKQLREARDISDLCCIKSMAPYQWQTLNFYPLSEGKRLCLDADRDPVSGTEELAAFVDAMAHEGRLTQCMNEMVAYAYELRARWQRAYKPVKHDLRAVTTIPADRRVLGSPITTWHEAAMTLLVGVVEDIYQLRHAEWWRHRLQQPSTIRPGCDAVVASDMSARYLGLSDETVEGWLREMKIIREEIAYEHELATDRLKKSKAQAPRKARPVAIPPKRQSKPVSLKYAATLLDHPGKGGAKWLRECIADGEYNVMAKSRQSFVFDVDQFPETVRKWLLPDPLTPKQG
jgi:hypothetical protein